MNGMFSARAQKQLGSLCIEVFLFDTRDGRRFAALPVEDGVEALNEGGYMPVSFRTDEAGAQALLDDLWNAGVRPSREVHEERSIAAQAKHLDDMRIIVSQKLGVTFK